MADNEKPGFLAMLKRPSAKYSLLSLLAVGFFSGIFFWGGFNTGMEATNTLDFCIGCHEMRDNVYVEYKKTIHDTNRTGVRAVCSDCHVPRDWTHKMIRKIQASKEVWGKITGVIDTPEKFEAHRLQLAGGSRQAERSGLAEHVADQAAAVEAAFGHGVMETDDAVFFDFHAGVFAGERIGRNAKG